MDNSMIIGMPSQGESRAYTLNHELYLTRDGRVVTRESTERVTFIGNKGQAIPFADAVRYGLVNRDGSATGVEVEGLTAEEPEAKDVKGPAESKDIKGPAKSKGR